MKNLTFLTAVVAISLATQIADAQDTADQLTINQWVQPVQEGMLTGRVVIPVGIGTTVAVDDAEVVVRNKEGDVFRAESRTSASGEFLIEGVQPGIYSLTAHADQTLAVCAIHVLDASLARGFSFSETVEIPAAEVDLRTLQTAITRYTPPASADAQNASVSGRKATALVQSVCGAGTFRVGQVRDGMVGRLFKAGMRDGNLESVGMTNVFIMKDGIEIVRAVTDVAGRFTIDSIGTGSYSLMAVGQDGLGLVGFELVALSEKTDLRTQGDKMFVRTSESCTSFAMQVAPVHNSAASFAADEHLEEQPIAEGRVLIADGGIPSGIGSLGGSGGGFVGSGGGGFTGGGGGLAGGGLGLGGLAALAGIGGAVAVVSSTGGDSDEIVNAPIASPVAPAN